MSIQLASDIQSNLRSRWAATTVLAYDILLTSDEEVGWVWLSNWSLPKGLYLFSRYFGLGTSLITSIVSCSAQTNRPASTCSCGVFNPAQSLCITISIAAPDALLLMRVLALFSHRRWVIRSLLFIYFAMITLFLILFGIETHIAVITNIPDTPNFGCLSNTGVPPGVQVVNLVPIVSLSFNALMFALTLITALPNRTYKMQIAPLIMLIVRDGSLYFALVCVTYALLVATTFLLGNRPGIEEVFLPWTIVVGPIAACRLFLNLRGSVRRPLHEVTVEANQPERPVFNTPSGISNTETATWFYERESTEPIELAELSESQEATK